MSDVTVEKKLKLIQQVRSQYNQNQYDLSNREQILYGRTSMNKISNIPYSEQPAALPPSIPGSFKIRLFAAILILIGILALDLSGKALLGFNAKDVFASIKKDLPVDSLNLPEELSDYLTQ